MVGDDQRDAGQPAGAYVEALKRGWLIVLAAAVLVPAAAYEISARQGPLFQATSEDVIGTQSSLQSSTQGPNSKDAQYYVATQAAIASSQTVASLALKIAKVPGMTPDGLLKQSSVSADPTSSIVVFTVSNRTHASAIKLANAYAQAFADYSRARATSALDTLIAANKKQINLISARITGIGATINRERTLGEARRCSKPSSASNTRNSPSWRDRRPTCSSRRAGLRARSPSRVLPPPPRRPSHARHGTPPSRLSSASSWAWVLRCCATRWTRVSGRRRRSGKSWDCRSWGDCRRLRAG